MDTVTQATFQGKDLRNRYHIFEGDNGLQISESRVLLFDVMDLHDKGDSIYDISRTFNLTPLQVQTAVDYIEKHRATLEPAFAKAVQRREERREYYDQLLEEHLKNRPPLPMTPERAAIYALLDKHRQPREKVADAEDSL